MNHILRSLSIVFLSINVFSQTFAMSSEKSMILTENSAVSVANPEFSNANINPESKIGSNRLLDAAKAGHNEVVRELLDAREEIRGEWESSALNCTLLNAAAGGHNDAIRKLLDLGADIDVRGEKGRTAVHLAAAEGRSATVSFLSGLNAKVNVHDSNLGHTPLHLAVWNARDETVRALIAAGANVKAISNEGSTALHYAVTKGHNKIMRLLIAAGADFNAIDEDCSTPLHNACYQNKDEVVSILLSAGANIDAQGYMGRTALHLAAQGGKSKIVSILISSGAKVNAQDSNNNTPLQFAAWKGHDEAVAILLAAGADAKAICKDACTALHLATREGHAKVMRLLIEAGADANAANVNNWTALHTASIKGDAENVGLLICAGADINAKNKVGQTLLHQVSSTGHLEVVRLLIQAGVDVNIHDTRNEDTPLQLAAWKGHEEIVKLLIKAGANVKAQRFDGCTALHFASAEGHDKVIGLLIKAGADVEAQNSGGLTALHFAGGDAQNKAAELLIAAGADLNAKGLYNQEKSQYGHTPLSLAAASGHIGTVEMLLTAGADPNLQRESGTTLLHSATLPENHETVDKLIKLLLPKVLNVDARNLITGSTALHAAALRGHVNAVNQLLAAGANVKAVNSKKMTALHFAAHGCHKKSDDIGAMAIYPGSECRSCCHVVKSLIDAGVPVDARNENGVTALELAVSQGHDAVVGLLHSRSSHNTVVDDADLAMREAAARALGRIGVIKVQAMEAKHSEEFRVFVQDILTEDQKYWHSSFSDLIISTLANRDQAKRAKKRLSIISQELFSRLNSLEASQVSLFIDFFEHSQTLVNVRGVKRILVELIRRFVREIFAKDQKEWILSLNKLIKGDLDRNDFDSVKIKLELIAEELFPKIGELRDETRVSGFIFFFQPAEQIKITGKVKEMLDILKGREKPKLGVNAVLASSFGKRRASVAEYRSDSEEDEKEPVDWDAIKPVAPRSSDSMSLANSSSCDSLSESSQSSKAPAIQTPPPIPATEETLRVMPVPLQRTVSLNNLKAKARALFEKPANKTAARK